jgi:predicted DNA-binding transcriptional regulator AlpA
MPKNIAKRTETRKVIIRIAEAALVIGISKSTIWARANPKSDRYDPDFPAIFPLHSNPSGRGAVGIFLDDIEEYLGKHREKTIGNKSARTAKVEAE